MSRAVARLLVVLLGTLAALAVAGPASAHVGGGAAGSNFDGRVTSLTPALPGVTVRVLQFGDDLELVNSSTTEVQVPGYDDEAHVAFDAGNTARDIADDLHLVAGTS